jgi:hypothetical protein
MFRCLAEPATGYSVGGSQIGGPKQRSDYLFAHRFPPSPAGKNAAADFAET